MTFGKYFCGNEISDYGKEHKRVDYATFAKAFDAVLNNEIMGKLQEQGLYFELENGEDYDEESDEYVEIYQFFIVSDNGASIIKQYTNEILYYCEEVDMYIWGVTHFGTSWDYVLTDIECTGAEPIYN